jgi:hypothetical protein
MSSIPFFFFWGVREVGELESMTMAIKIFNTMINHHIWINFHPSIKLNQDSDNIYRKVGGLRATIYELKIGPSRDIDATSCIK